VTDYVKTSELITVQTTIIKNSQSNPRTGEAEARGSGAQGQSEKTRKLQFCHQANTVPPTFCRIF
jgi:hypothetical protein